jgi:uncharacterized protein (DUF1684 family)
MPPSPARAYVAELNEERRMKDRFMGTHPESPFLEGQVPFVGLRYFPVNRKFRVPARLKRLETPTEGVLRTNRDGQLVMRHIGDFEFRLNGRELKLRVYHAGEGAGPEAFVPFRDATSGRETYGPGRYLTVPLHEGEGYELDFNRAFNPYCAYTDAYECGFPPAENDLPVRIPAGEKVWSPERNPATPSTVVRELYRKAATKRAAAPRARRPSRAPDKSNPRSRSTR